MVNNPIQPSAWLVPNNARASSQFTGEQVRDILLALSWQGGTEAAVLSSQCGAEAAVLSSQCGAESAALSSQCGAEAAVPSSVWG